MLPPLEPESSASAIPPSPLADKSYITTGNMNCKEFFEKNRKFLVQVVFKVNRAPCCIYSEKPGRILKKNSIGNTIDKIGGADICTQRKLQNYRKL